jgi:hypothetical protein
VDVLDLLEYVFGFQVCAYYFSILVFNMYDCDYGMG